MDRREQSVSAAAPEPTEALQLEVDTALLETMMDDFPETIYFKDWQSRFTRINRYAAAHYGM